MNVELPSTLFFIKYEDLTRYKSWEQIAQEEQNIFFDEIANNQKSYRLQWGLNSFTHIPNHIFYKTFKLRGEKLWIASKLLHAAMGIAVTILVFLIGDLYFGFQVGFIAGILTFFSPHLWVLFNISADPSQPYNVFFGLFTIYAFLKFLERDHNNIKRLQTLRFRGQIKNQKGWLYLCGIAMGINFLFLHTGSFVFPIIILLICIYKSFLVKNFRQIGNYFITIIIAFVVGAFLNECHAAYFNLPYNPIISHMEDVISFGSAGSHTIQGLVILDFNKLSLNIKDHIGGVFLSGVTTDWHHGSSLTGIPMVYNYFIFFIFLFTCAYLVRIQREREFVIFLWFFSFFFIYTFLVFVRQKNIPGELPPIFILAARGLAPLIRSLYRTPLIPSLYRNLDKFLQKKLTRKLLKDTFLKTIIDKRASKLISYKKAVYGLGIFLIVSSIVISTEKTLSFLPSKGYFGAYRSIHEVYRTISGEKPSPKTHVISNGGLSFEMSMRLFGIDKKFKMNSLRNFGIGSALNETELNKWKDMESNLLKENSKIYYCFTWFNNYLGFQQGDSTFEKMFQKIHPENRPIRTIFNTNNRDILWSIYEVQAAVAAAEANLNTAKAAWQAAKAARTAAKADLDTAKAAWQAAKPALDAAVATANAAKQAARAAMVLGN